MTLLIQREHTFTDWFSSHVLMEILRDLSDLMNHIKEQNSYVIFFFRENNRKFINHTNFILF